jgi:hypothetical protein
MPATLIRPTSVVKRSLRACITGSCRWDDLH